MTTLESVEKIMAQVETLWRKTTTSALYMLSYDATELRRQVVLDNDKLLLAQDGIRIALKTAGYENVDSMTQFERASAMLDMAQEYNANRESLAHYEYVFDDLAREIANVRKRDTRKAEVWEHLCVRSWDQTLRGNPA